MSYRQEALVLKTSGIFWRMGIKKLTRSATSSHVGAKRPKNLTTTPLNLQLSKLRTTSAEELTQ